MPAKRVLISIDERILARIDDAARRDGLTRSRFLAQAAIAQIEESANGREGLAMVRSGNERQADTDPSPR
jgi:metal-responsive CopG/Arc/MetJ family transcriptional regulator